MNPFSTPTGVLFTCRTCLLQAAAGVVLLACCCLAFTVQANEAQKGCREAFANHANTIHACNVLISSPSLPIPQLIRALEIRAQAFLALGQPLDALSDYTFAIGYLPVGKLQGYILYLRGKTYLTHVQGRLAEALADLERANSQAPANTRILEALATAYETAGQTEKALRTATEAVGTDPRSVTALKIIATAHEKRGQSSLALKALDDLLEQSPHDPEIMEWRGRIHQRRNNLYAALADYRNAVRLRSSDELLDRIRSLEKQFRK